MTIKNGHLSKQLVLYPPAQPSLEHNLPLWLEEEEEDEVYSAQLYTIETSMGGGQLDEDDLIGHILQNPTPNTLSLEEIAKETKGNNQIDLCLADSNPTHVKIIKFSLERTLKINPSLSVHQEEELCNMLREHLDAFAWSYK